MAQFQRKFKINSIAITEGVNGAGRDLERDTPEYQLKDIIINVESQSFRAGVVYESPQGTKTIKDHVFWDFPNISPALLAKFKIIVSA